MKKWLVSIVLFCCASGGAQAQQTANDLLGSCEIYERTAVQKGDGRVTMPNIDSAVCFTYFTAVHQFVYLHLDGPGTPGTFPFICPPSPNGPTSTQFIRIFLAYARANPQDLHQHVALPVLTSLARAFPCPK